MYKETNRHSKTIEAPLFSISVSFVLFFGDRIIRGKQENIIINKKKTKNKNKPETT